MRILLSILLSLFFTACFARLELPKEPTINEAKDLNISYEWYKAYENEKINKIISYVLQNNSEINTARTALLSALARADLINYDLYPTLSANLGYNTSKNLNSGISSDNFNNNLNLSYELDIFGKIRASVSASEFSAKASAYDLKNLEISMINTALNSIFELAYFNDVEKLLKEYISNLEELNKLYSLKYTLGKIEELDLLNIEQSLLKAIQFVFSLFLYFL